jgi:hypothetical protein
MTPPTHETRIALADALVALSATDLAYGDLYLHRAQEIFEPILSTEQYRALCGERDALPVLARELRELVGRRDWSQARVLAQRGARDRQRISENERLLVLGDALYAPRVFRADPAGLALAGFDVHSVARLDAVRDACLARLRFALTNDADLADFYRERLAALADLTLRTNGAQKGAPDTANLQRRILEAADNADFAQAERLSAALMNAAANGTGHGPGHVPARGASLAPSLVAQFSDAVIKRAGAIALTAVTLEADATLSGYLSLDVDGAGRPEALAEWPRTDAVVPGGDDCWYSLSVNLRDALDLLRRQPCMSSAGSRYLPMFEPETLLVETFSEREPDASSDLLKSLALPRRRGLSRIAIEDAVRSRSRDVCAALGLDPARHAVIPIPFDAYLRLAPRYNWGTERLWTHFDGYQVNHGLTLRALVGGDAGYGGAADLCSVARDYESERIVTRLCIVRRERLIARGG